MRDINNTGHTGTYRNTDDIDPAYADPEGPNNMGGCGDITRELHQTIMPGGAMAAANRAQAESDAAFRELQRQYPTENTAPRK